MCKYWRSPPSIYTGMGPFCLWSCYVSFHASPAQEKAWLLVQSQWRWITPPYPNTLFSRGSACTQESTFEKVTVPDFSFCSLDNALFNLILWQLFCSLIRLLFFVSTHFLLLCDVGKCALYTTTVLLFHLTCILAQRAADRQLAFSGYDLNQGSSNHCIRALAPWLKSLRTPGLNLSLQHCCQISYPFLKI